MQASVQGSYTTQVALITIDVMLNAFHCKSHPRSRELQCLGLSITLDS